jgi:putative restriction endonuclease
VITYQQCSNSGLAGNGKAVLFTKIGSIYDDLPEERYHFPRQYLGRMEASVGDWIIYYAPGRLTVESARRAGRRAYFATACLDRIEADQARPNHFYAFVRDYLEFDRVVPFKEGTHYYESKLGNPDGTTNACTAQNAVRHLPDREYDLILQAGFAPVLTAEPDLQNRTVAAGLSEEALVFDRPIVERLVVRPFRDAAFAMAVKTAYQDTCAITGFKIINGGGGSEVQAAHIQPVVDRGPDSVRNGIALCSTMHWMFDRGLISIDDDLSILVARSHVPDTVGRLINSSGRVRGPERVDFRPHPHFLAYHRREVFKG